MSLTAFQTEDMADVLDLMAAFNEESGYPFDSENCGKLLAEILGNPALGQIWLLQENEECIGYVAICYCFSFEHGGRDAFVDEIYLKPSHRRKGLGCKMLQSVRELLPSLGIHALHLEVEDNNATARQLYEQIGFRATTRRLMTLKN